MASKTLDSLTAASTLDGTEEVYVVQSSNSRKSTTQDIADLTTTITGNAGTATKLATARNIDGQSFDGTADITVIAPGTHAATSKTTPVDADEIPLVDSAASNVLKKLTWANLKAALQETGTFTPVLKFGGATTGITYSTQTGSYIAIGSLVLVSVSIILTSKGTATGAATIEGLPFASAGSATCAFDGFNFSTLTAGLTGLISGAGSTAVTLRIPGSNGYNTATDANVNNTSIIRFTVVYSK